MKILKKQHAPLATLLIGYAITRLLNLTILPIFTDEAIYIYWAKIIESSHAQWFVSLTDGKPPLLIWMISFFLTVLPDSWYLVAGRLPAVLAGGVSVVAVYKLTELLFEKKSTSVIATVLYIIFPFTLLYDRMALFDSLLQATLLSATYFALKTAKTLDIRYAVLWGFALGLAFLSKPTALLFVLLLPASVLLFTSHTLKKKWKRVGVLIVLAVGIAEVINNLQRVSSVYFMAAKKNAQFQQPIEELLNNPFALTIGNMQGFFNWIVGYYTLPILLLGMLGLIFLLAKHFKQGLVLFALWIVPIIGLATIGREIFPRYILFTTPYFLIATAWVFGYLYMVSRKFSMITLLLGGAVIVPLLITDVKLLTKPESASLPQTDYDQLIGSHPSGYGVDEVYDYINEQIAQNQKITLVTQGTFGLYPYAFDLEYWDLDLVTILPRWPLDTIDKDIIDAQKNSRVIVVLKEHESIPPNLPLTLIKKIEKPGGKFPILITKLDLE